MSLPVLFSSPQLSSGIKIGAAFALVQLMMLLATLATHQRLQQLSEALARPGLAHQAIAELDQLVQTMNDQEHGMNGYLFAADPKFFQRHQKDAEAFDRSLARVRKLIGDNPTQQTRLTALQELTHAWRRNLEGASIVPIAVPAMKSQAQPAERHGAGESSVDSIRSLVARIKAVELELLSEWSSEQQNALRSAKTALLIGMLASLATAAIVAMLLRRSIAQPMKTVAATIRRLAAGDIGLDVVGTSRRDEVGQAGRALQRLKQVLVDRQGERSQVATARRMGELIRSFCAGRTRTVSDLECAHNDVLAASRSAAVIADRNDREAALAMAAFEKREQGLHILHGLAQRLASRAAEAASWPAGGGATALVTAEGTEHAVGAVAKLRDLASGALFEEIDAAAREVDQVVERTRLLAVHARIEAAKAGHAGEGFAVLAKEMSEFAAAADGSRRSARDRLINVRRSIDATLCAVEAMAAACAEASRRCSALSAFADASRADVQAILLGCYRLARQDEALKEELMKITRTAADHGAVVARLSQNVAMTSQRRIELCAMIDRFLADTAAV